MQSPHRLLCLLSSFWLEIESELCQLSASRNILNFFWKPAKLFSPKLIIENLTARGKYKVWIGRMFNLNSSLITYYVSRKRKGVSLTPLTHFRTDSVTGVFEAFPNNTGRWNFLAGTPTFIFGSKLPWPPWKTCSIHCWLLLIQQVGSSDHI